MSTLDDRHGIDRVANGSHVAAAERLARATVFAFELCDEQGTPLSHAQKVALVESALLEFDGLEASLTSQASLDAFLRSLLRDEPPG
jgi:hypothetical protein